MVKVFEGTEQEFYIDGFLKSNLDTAKAVIKKDWDMVFCIDGYEGSGKSVLAQQCAYYCDPTLTLDRITFDSDSFCEAVLKAEKEQAVIFDEAYGGLSSRAAMSRVNKGIVSMLAEIRQKNLFVFVVMPTFFDLDKYVALWRSRALLHVYTGDNFQRGFFSFYNIDKKKDLYVNGKKFYNYGNPKANFYSRFTNHYTVDSEKYKAKKLQALRSYSQRTEDNTLEVKKAAEDLIIEWVEQGKLSLPLKDLMAGLGISREALYYRRKKAHNTLREKEKKNNLDLKDDSNDEIF